MRGPALVAAVAVVLIACAAPPGPGARVSPTFSPPVQVELVVHSEPGGGIDLDAREWVRLLGQEGLLDGTWRVESRAGGAGLRAMTYLSSQRGREDLIAAMTVTWLVTPLSTREAAVTYLDLTPIAMLFEEPTVAVVRAASPYRTFEELLAAARERPGRLNQAGGQVSSAHNIYREILQDATGARWNFVPLASRGERMAALLGGHAELLFTEPSDVLELVRSGDVRVLASLGPERTPSYPDAPTLGELGIVVDLPKQRRGIVGPPGMTAAAVGYYESRFRELTETAAWKEHLRRGALRPDFLAGSELARTLEADNTRLLEVLRRLGIAVR